MIANAIRVAQVATGEAEEEYVDPGKQRGGKEGARARAKSLTQGRRREIARKAGETRWPKKG